MKPIARVSEDAESWPMYLLLMHMAATREIERPCHEVFAFFSDASNNPEWQKGMVSCIWISDGPIGVGSTYEQTARFMGRAITSTFRVTDYEPDHLIAITTIESTFPISVVRRVETIGEGRCRVSAEISGGPTGAARFLEPLMKRQAQKSVDGDYDRLVLLLESANTDSTPNSPSE